MLEASAVIAMIVGLAEVAKALGLSAKFVPLLNVALGVAVACLAGGEAMAENVLMGAAAGLTASGLYSGVKNVWQGLQGSGEVEQ